MPRRGAPLKSFTFTDTDGTSSYDEEEVQVELVEAFELSDLHPNPFSGKVCFELAVGEVQDVRAELRGKSRVRGASTYLSSWTD